MQMDRKNALKIWEETFGKVVEAADFSGRKINKSAYDQRSSKFGWVIAWILPKSEGGHDTKDNYICLHVETAAEKGDNFPFFNVCDKKYRLTNENDQGKWVIEEALDSESIAEQEAKNAAAMEKWDQLFGSQYSKAKDFCGREIHKDDYGTDGEFSWKVASYVDSKPMDNKNSYIAHTVSVEEATGKTAFKANGKNYTLNKDNGAYFFKTVEVKPPKKVFDIKNPYEAATRITEIRTANGADENAMLNILVIRAVTKAGCTAVAAQNITDSISMILREGIGEWLSMELSDMADEQGVRYMFLTYRFLTPTPTELEKVFNGAQLLNTYSLMLLGTLGLDELKIYDYACFVNRTQLRYPVTLLCGFNPQFKALMDSIYGSAYGYYPGENATTLYVSHFIVFNVPSLAAMHPENATQYFTEAEMVEHNSFDPDLSGRLFRMMSGESESSVMAVTAESEVTEEAEITTETEPEVSANAAVSEITEPEVSAEESIVEEVVPEKPADNTEAAAETDAAIENIENEPIIAPVIDETAEVEAVAEIEDEIFETSDGEPIAGIAEIVETVEAEAGESTADEPIIEPVTEETAEDAESEAVAEQVEEAVEESPIDEPAEDAEEGVCEAPAEAPVITKHTPEGEQLTMAFPAHTEKEDPEDDGDILTIDLDSLD